MDKQGNSALTDNAKHNPDEKTQDNLKATDSWLISLSRDLGRACKWSNDEIAMLFDSAKCAFDTTQKVSKKMLKRLKRDGGLSRGKKPGSAKAPKQTPKKKSSPKVAGARKPQTAVSSRGKKKTQKKSPGPSSGKRAVAGSGLKKVPQVSSKGSAGIAQEAPKQTPKKKSAPKVAGAKKPQTAAPSKGKKKTQRKEVNPSPKG